MARMHTDQPTLGDKQVFTTGEAAELCNVSQQTIIRCFDNGRLEGFRVPGSRFRRIPRDSLIRFMIDSGIPTRCFHDEPPNVLLVGVDSCFNALIQEKSRLEKVNLHVAVTAWDAGVMLGRLDPSLVIVAGGLPDLEMIEVEQLARESASSELRVISCGTCDTWLAVALDAILLIAGNEGAGPADQDACATETHPESTMIPRFMKHAGPNRDPLCEISPIDHGRTVEDEAH